MKISATRQLIRWLVLGAFLVVALFYLKDSIYIAWPSGGVPTPPASGWPRPAIEQFCFAAAALCFGIGLFKGIRTFPAATGGSAAFIVLGALLAISPAIGRFVSKTHCHDRGGSWNRQTLQCSDE